MLPVRIVLVGPDDLMRDILHGALSADPIRVVGEAADLDEALLVGRRTNADVLLVRPFAVALPPPAQELLDAPGHPAVLGLDGGSQRALVVMEDVSSAGLRDAVLTAARDRHRRLAAAGEAQ